MTVASRSAVLWMKTLLPFACAMRLSSLAAKAILHSPSGASRLRRHVVDVLDHARGIDQDGALAHAIDNQVGLLLTLPGDVAGDVLADRMAHGRLVVGELLDV